MRDCKVCKANNARTVRSLQKLFPKPPEGSRCDLCNRSEKRLFLDHDHNLSGPESFRGYLCLRCNVSATSYSIPELEQTIAYLRSSQLRSRMELRSGAAGTTYSASSTRTPSELRSRTAGAGTKMVQVEEVDDMGVLPPQRPIFRGRTVLPRFDPRRSQAIVAYEPQPKRRKVDTPPLIAISLPG